MEQRAEPPTQAGKEKQLNPRKPRKLATRPPRVLSPQPSLTADGAAHGPVPRPRCRVQELIAAAPVA